MKRPDDIPQDWILMKAEDGCRFWVSPEGIKKPEEYACPCQKQVAEDKYGNWIWHEVKDMKEVKTDGA